jgi:hypothetical protein
MKISDYPDLISDDESSFFIAADWLEEQGRNYEAECLQQGYVFGFWLNFSAISLDYILGHGDGHGYGTSYGDGYGDGISYGYGTSYGSGDGYGFGYGDGFDAGYGFGDGAGFGDGDSTSFGDGDDASTSTGYQNSYTNTLLSFFKIVSRNLI